MFFYTFRPDEQGYHGDGVPFNYYDVAHAFFPENIAIASDIHINMMKRFALFDPPHETGKYMILLYCTLILICSTSSSQ